MATFQEIEQEQQRYLQTFKQMSDQTKIINQLVYILSYSQKALKSSGARRHIKNTIASLQNKQPIDFIPATTPEIVGSAEDEVKNDPYFQSVENIVRKNQFLGDYKKYSFIELLKNDLAYQIIVEYIQNDERARDIKLTSEQRDIILAKIKEWKEKLKRGIISKTRAEKKLESRIAQKLQELERAQAQGKLTPSIVPQNDISQQKIQPPQISNLVFYACYGSNLLEERFDKYIQRCKDKSKPCKIHTYTLPYELYFGEVKLLGISRGGKAFIGHKKSSDKTFSKVYLISKEQFMDVFSQENGGNASLSEQDLNEAKQIGFKDISTKTAYGRLIYLETRNYDIFTFTDTGDIGVKRKIAKPDEKEYLPQIIKGLRETYKLEADQIRDYLIKKRGIAENYSPQTLITLIKGIIIFRH
jgi:hypothetical protein